MSEQKDPGIVSDIIKKPADLVGEEELKATYTIIDILATLVAKPLDAGDYAIWRVINRCRDELEVLVATPPRLQGLRCSYTMQNWGALRDLFEKCKQQEGGK